MVLGAVQPGTTFYFKGFPKELCRVIKHGERETKVEENGETSWYNKNREVYPVAIEIGVTEKPAETVVDTKGDPTYWKKYLEKL